jgi:hypothetical protein
MNALLRLSLGALVMAAVFYLAWRIGGALGLVFLCPLLALLARPLLEALGGYPRFVTRIVMRKFEGRYYEFRGRSMDIEIDDHACCWISTADVRKLTDLPVDAVLCRLYPGECRESGDPMHWRITTNALTQFLAKATDPDLTKFGHWLEVGVARPARNKRERRLLSR